MIYYKLVFSESVSCKEEVDNHQREMHKFSVYIFLRSVRAVTDTLSFDKEDIF